MTVPNRLARINRREDRTLDRLAKKQNENNFEKINARFEKMYDKLENKKEQIQNNPNQGNWFQNNVNAIGEGINIASTLGDTFMNYGDRSEEAQVTDNIASGLMSTGNPYAVAAGAVMEAGKYVGQLTGMGSSFIDKHTANTAGVSKLAQAGNNVATALNSFGLGSRSTDSISTTPAIQNLSGAYSGTADFASTMADASGKNYFFGKNKIDAGIEKARQDIAAITTQDRINTLPKKSNYNLDLAQQWENKIDGISFNSMIMAKNGAKLPTIEEVRAILASRKIAEESIEAFQNGGSIMNPAGALHAHLNHIEDVNKEIGEEVTQKGIPVVTTDEEGNIEQVAEIEKDELIFSKELTTEIEKLWKDGSDEAMIKAGKLIAEALITDSTDNTGLINNIE